MRYRVWSGVRPSYRSTAAAAGLLLSSQRAEHIDRHRRAPSSNGTTARRLAANAGNAMLAAELTWMNIDLFKGMCIQE